MALGCDMPSGPNYVVLLHSSPLGFSFPQFSLLFSIMWLVVMQIRVVIPISQLHKAFTFW
jgi:hypothetical protein